MCKCLFLSLYLSLCGFLSFAVANEMISRRWNPEGVLIGKFAVSGGSNNFAFVPGGMYLFNGYKVFKITFKAEGRTVRRDFGLGAGMEMGMGGSG